MFPKTLTFGLRSAHHTDLNLAANMRYGATKNRVAHTAVSPISRTHSPLIFFAAPTLQDVFVQCLDPTTPASTHLSALRAQVRSRISSPSNGARQLICNPNQFANSPHPMIGFPLPFSDRRARNESR
jgi:hypothetical protein